MAVDELSLVVERRDGEFYIEMRRPIGVGEVPAFGQFDGGGQDLVAVGDNLFLRADRLGAFATEANLPQVSADVRAAYWDYRCAALD